MDLFDEVGRRVSDALQARLSSGPVDSHREPDAGEPVRAGLGTEHAGGWALPDLAVQAVAEWLRAGAPRQAPIAWPQEEWIAAFPEISDTLGLLDNPLGRRDVRECVDRLPNDDHGATVAFVVCMAWGYGRTGYGRHRTRTVLESNPDASAKLAEARAIARGGGLRAAFDAYEYMAGKGRLHHLGPAFGTKFIHFHNIEGLILDKLTAEWYERACGVNLMPTQWNPGKYREYLAFMGGWAEGLGVEPSQLEEIAFRQVSRERGNQWA